MHSYQQNQQQNNGFSNGTPQPFGNTMPVSGYSTTSPLALPLGYPNMPNGQQLPQAYTQMPQGYLQMSQASPQIPQACPQIPQACPQIPQACPQMTHGYPQSSPYQSYSPIPNQSFPAQAFPPAPIGFRQTSLPQGIQVYPQSNQLQGLTSSTYNQSQSQLPCSMPGVPTAYYYH